MMLATPYKKLAPGDRMVPWILQCRQDWRFKPVKYLCAVNQSALPETTDPDYQFIYFDISSVDSDGRWTASEPIVFADAPSRARRIVRNGDVLISTVRTYLRAITYLPRVDQPIICSTGFAVLTGGPNVYPGFLAYWVRSSFFIDEIVARSVGVSYPAINASEIGNLPFPCIPIDEQRAIAAFLDGETARIDALIEKKERQIELLQEKRTAVISDCVTGKAEVVRMKDENGNLSFRLQPSSFPKKDSGIEWLGEIPEHWETLECKFGFSIQLGKMLQNEPQTLNDEQVPYLKALNVQWENVDVSNLPEMWASPEDIRKYSVESGDLLVCEGGEVGRAGILRNPPAKCIIQNALHRVRPKGDNSSRFLMYLLEVASYRGWFNILCSKATIAHFTGEKFGWLSIALPPAGEQRAIAAFLDQETARIDALIEKIRKSIDLLREYRTALITAAVTGKIDVRGAC